MRPRIRQGADFRAPKGAARVVERQVAAGPAAGSAYDRGQRPGPSRGKPQPHASELQRADPDLQHTFGLGERSAAAPRLRAMPSRGSTHASESLLLLQRRQASTCLAHC